MNLKKLIFTNNDCYKRGRTIKPKGIMVHSTGANNPKLSRYVGPDDGLLGKNAHGNHWNVPGLSVCVHGFIGKLKDGSIATYQTLPWKHRGWHCGKGKKGSGNDSYISFEICEDGLEDKTYFDKVYREAVELSAYLCKEFDFNPVEDGVIICHCEGYERGIASNHADVMHWFRKHGKDMDDFRSDVKKLLDSEKTPVSVPEPETNTEEENDMKLYDTLDEIPEWAKPTIEKLVNANALKGEGDGLGLSYEMLRTFVVLDRLGKL